MTMLVRNTSKRTEREEEGGREMGGRSRREGGRLGKWKEKGRPPCQVPKARFELDTCISTE